MAGPAAPRWAAATAGRLRATAAWALLGLLLASQLAAAEQQACLAPEDAAAAGGSTGLRPPDCTLTFIGYRPSSWEQHWRSNVVPAMQAAAEPRSVCPLVAEHPERVQTWLEGVQQASSVLGGDGDAASLQAWAATDRAVFSAFEWEDPCTGEIISAPIEPLVGHFRHPLGPQCNQSSDVAIEDRDYLLLSGLTALQFRRLYPGRRLLMDFGSSLWPDSLGWLVDRYSERGVDFFDEIWAWEAADTNHSEYWSQVPADLQHRLHFNNIPLGGDVNAVNHPVQWLKQVVRPGDFLAIKLDIDHSPTEMAFMRALRDDAELRGLVSEMMFEMHYMHDDMWEWFYDHVKEYSWPDVFNLFYELRGSGLRLHYWP